MSTRILLRSITGALLLALVCAPAVAEDNDIPTMVESIFAGRPAQAFVSIVLNDGARRQYLAFHISTYLDIKELRVYRVPYASADTGTVDAALDQDDHEAAFETLLSGMDLQAGAQYVSDVSLDGIRDVAVPLGSGSLKDNFHRQQFPTHAEADTAYRSWLQRGLELKSS